MHFARLPGTQTRDITTSTRRRSSASPRHRHASITSMAHRDDRIRSRDSGSSASSSSRRAPAHFVTKDAASFMALMGDMLRLQEQSLAMAYLYMHRYTKFIRDGNHATGEPVRDFLDDHTLALTCLSLSTKATESPRRLRSLIVPAYALLHPPSTTTTSSPAPALRVPSHKYDTLRATIVTAELHLLRILKFELRLPLPHDYIPRILDAALSIIPGEDYAALPPDRMAEDNVADAADTFLGRQCMGLATRCLQVYAVATYYTARTIACGVVGVVLDGSGILPGEGMARWVERVMGRDVEVEDYEDVVTEISAVYLGVDRVGGSGNDGAGDEAKSDEKS
ncbi:Cyclin-T1-4 [Drechslerella dactyloides]|uniref:RNA polymerase II holoenzyme cyclin-like subunit n=1 Tax=Drechslerella dactyloides TaxID=74499 RepID=A0AAD6IWU9_DREDA|nr:Cyclin-T1-4 [Drechslerella dactyloides]